MCSFLKMITYVIFYYFYSAFCVDLYHLLIIPITITTVQAILHSFKTVLTEEVRMILRSTLLFEDWSDADIDFLASAAIVRNYGSNTEIQKSGEKVNCLSMIKSGEFLLSLYRFW